MKNYLFLITLAFAFAFASCSGEKLTDEEETEVQNAIDKDQEKLDSMRKVLEEKIYNANN